MVSFAGFANITYSKNPDVIVSTIDQRMESNARPVCRYKYSMTIPAGSTQISARLTFNASVTQIIMKVPVLSGAETATLKIFDVIGANLYNSGAKAHSSTHILFSSAQLLDLAGENSLEITLSASESEPKTVEVLIYGT